VCGNGEAWSELKNMVPGESGRREEACRGWRRLLLVAIRRKRQGQAMAVRGRGVMDREEIESRGAGEAVE
jgi:hypothetical protein